MTLISEPRTGFTLIELMLVLATLSLLLVMAVPSWRHVHTDAVINEARLTLDRLVIRQLRFSQQHQRYAKASELPPPQEQQQHLGGFDA